MRLLLVDGTNVVMRCASVQLGVPRAQVIASAGRMIRRAAVEVIGATHLIVAFDAPGHSFRHARYPAYKAHRGERQQETERWAVDAGHAFAAAGVCCVFAEAFEADDVIATLAMRATSAGERGLHDVHILSGDSDLLALASPQVHCWQFARKDDAPGAFVVERSPAWICQRYGLAAVAQLTDYKALVGEPGDNVQGVRGIGPAKARALLRRYGSIERMIEFGELEAPDLARAMRDLITLRTDAPVPMLRPAACRVVRGSAAA